jgi:hypothetical protein
MNYTVYNKTTMEVIRTGSCPESMFYQQAINPDEAVCPGKSCDIEDTIEIHEKGYPVIKRRPKQEIDSRRSAMMPQRETLPKGQQRADITNDQLTELMARIQKLEAAK